MKNKTMRIFIITHLIIKFDMVFKTVYLSKLPIKGASSHGIGKSIPCVCLQIVANT